MTQAPVIVEWTEFNYEDKDHTQPPVMVPVWIYESGEGVTFGYFDGVTFRMWFGSDDCNVERWAHIKYPEAPE